MRCVALPFLLLLVALLPLAACSGGNPPPSASSANPQAVVANAWPVAGPGKVLAYWVQLGPGGVAEARVVMSGTECPSLVQPATRDYAIAMTIRAAATPEFPLLCSASLPAGIKAATIRQIEQRGDRIPLITDEILAMPVSDPQRILVLGDTGCRLKGTALQACNNPKQWPFAALAGSAAKLKPDLVIHLGDYLYRENACPPNNTGCQGTPFGDNWPTWDADFFSPAAPLLQAAPWAFVRGNHEDCRRAGFGFTRLLGPLPFDASMPCVDHLPAYGVSIGAESLLVMDDANAPDTSIDASAIPIYQQELGALAILSKPVWLVMHRPIWGAISGPLGLPVGGNATLIAATEKHAFPEAVKLMLAGHIHTFEAINYKDRVPPQILAGNGGDNLDVTPKDLVGTIFQGNSGVAVKDGLSVGGFGFLLMTKADKGWDIQLYDQDGAPVRKCIFADGRVDCPVPTK